MNSISLNPLRLKLARLRNRMSIKALAEDIGMTSRMISNYENGHAKIIPYTTAEKISRSLGYPIDFFCGGDVEELDAAWVSFRSMKGMTAAVRDAALSAGSIALLFNEWLENKFTLPTSQLEDLRIHSPETAASVLRRKWGISDLSVSNMVHLLESKGVRVFSLSENSQEVDAFSFWKNEVPFIFLNTFKSAERSRFDAAHELGHLVLHKHGGPIGREAEMEADKFASAFLMPESTIRTYAKSLLTLDDVIFLKKYWKVSVAALIRRIYDLGIISEWTYRSLSIQVSQRGFFKREPESIERETSQVLSKIFLALREEGIKKDDIAKALSIPTGELEQLVFSLAFIGTTVNSNKKNINSDRRNKPSLKIVN